MQAVNYKKYNPVITISLKGKILVSIVRFYYRIRQWLGKNNWQNVIHDHHEDPLSMTVPEKLFLGYKYYFRALVDAEKGSGLDKYFYDQHLQLNVPKHFIPSNSITLSAGGDLIPYTCIQPSVCKNLWNQIGDFFFDADIVFANLETPADFSKPCSAAPEVMLHDMYFNADAATMKIFSGNGAYKGYDVVSIANNHSLDTGIDGLQKTMQLLKEKNIAYAGGALTEKEQHQFPILERNGIKTAFIAATFSFNKEKLPEEKKWMCNHSLLNQANPDISLLKTQSRIASERGADITIAALHMGCAYQAYPGVHIVNNIHHICDETGIDIIIAGHPHHAQPMELYQSPVSGKQHFIVYSLGDFIAYDIFKWGHLCMLLKLQISKGMLHNQPHTCITGIQVKPAYMHATITNGSVTSLGLHDYLKAKENREAIFSSKKDLVKFNDSSSFFETFVMPPHRQHVMV